MDNNTAKNDYKQREEKVMDAIGIGAAGIETGFKEASKNLEISNIGKSIFKWTPKPIGGIANIHSIATAQGEKEVFKEVYKMGVSSVTSGALGTLAGATCTSFAVSAPLAPTCAVAGAMGGNYFGNKLADVTSDTIYPFYKTAKDFIASNSLQSSSDALEFSIGVTYTPSYLSLIIDTSSNNPNNPKDFSSSSNLIPLTIIKATIEESLEDLF
ncbi:hypothetical protein B6S12_08890, partial [Helicobacter valdiviensis]